MSKKKKVTEFAELLPVFADIIIRDEITGSSYCRLGERFGKLPLDWGINWQTTKPTNYPDDYPEFTGAINVYINSYSLFGDKCAAFGRKELKAIIGKIKVFFFDHWNTTFYFKPDEVEEGLKTLEAWYVQTCEGVGEYLKQERKKELEAELSKLEG